MSLYPSHNKFPFIFLSILLFALLLLLIPLRPSNWGQDQDNTTVDSTTTPIDTPVFKDSVITEITTIQDTQIVVTPSADSQSVDTAIVVAPVEIVDTVDVIPVEVISPPLAEEEEIPTPEEPTPTQASLDWWGIVRNLLLLLGLTGGLAMLIYRLVNSRMEKKYWLEYSADLQPIGDYSPVKDSINIDFSAIAVDATSTKPEVLTDDSPITDHTPTISEEQEDDTDDAHEQQTDASITEPKEITTKDKNTEPSPTKTNTADKQNKTAVGSNIPAQESLFSKGIKEFCSRPIKIAAQVFRGLASIVQFFSSDTNKSKTPSDFKWQDGVYIVLVFFSILTSSVLYPYQPERVMGYATLFFIIWGMASILRLHWANGVLGILIILGEIIAIVIYFLLEALKDAPPSNGDGGMFGYIVGGVLVVFIFYRLYKNNKLPTIRLPKISLATIAFITLLAAAAYALFGSYVLDYGQVYFDWIDVLIRLFILYLCYLILASIFRTPSDTKSTSDVPKTTPVAPDEHTEVETSDNYSSPDLQELFRQKDWWKKVDLHHLEEVSMPNHDLTEESDFVRLYLPDCLNTRFLYLSNNQLTSIPFEITMLETLEVLNLSHNRITNINIDITFLPALHTLYLAHNNIKTIPIELQLLPQLQLLDVSGNPLSQVELDKLKELLPKTTIKHSEPYDWNEDETLVAQVQDLLKEELKQSHTVTDLWEQLDDQGLEDLPISIISSFPKLKRLSLFANNFTTIPQAILDCHALEELYLADNPLKNLPPEINQLSELRHLDISDTKIVYISPLWFPKLEILAIEDQEQRRIPNYIFELRSLRKLSLASNNIRNISPKLLQLQDLTQLDLSYNKRLERTVQVLSKLSNLRELRLDGLYWDATSMALDLNKLSNLTYLSIQVNQFQDIPTEILQLTGLTTLDFGHNQLHKIPKAIEQLKDLCYLYLGHNHIKKLPKSIKKLTQLRVLDLCSNPISDKEITKLKRWLPHTEILTDDNYEAPEASEAPELENEQEPTPKKEDKLLVAQVQKILQKELKNPLKTTFSSALMQKSLDDLPLSVMRQFSNLNILLLNSNLFKEIPEAVYHLPKLNTLNLSYNKITHIPDRIAELSTLKDLTISSNPIVSFSPKLVDMKQLTRLGLTNLGLKEVPEFVLAMPQLERLQLGSNHILRIPESFGKLQALKELNLDFTGLSEISAPIFELKRLMSLSWQGNNLTVLPEEISQLKQLHTLALGHNPEFELKISLLGKLPNLKKLFLGGLPSSTEAFNNLHALRQLDSLWLNNNQLNSLPLAVCKLKKLRSLSLSENNLTHLPKEISKLRDLEYLYLDGNQLTKLPKDIKQLKKLRTLVLSKNNFNIRERRSIQRMLPNVSISF